MRGDSELGPYARQCIDDLVRQDTSHECSDVDHVLVVQDAHVTSPEDERCHLGSLPDLGDVVIDAHLEVGHDDAHRRCSEHDLILGVLQHTSCLDTYLLEDDHCIPYTSLVLEAFLGRLEWPQRVSCMTRLVEDCPCRLGILELDHATCEVTNHLGVAMVERDVGVDLYLGRGRVVRCGGTMVHAYPWADEYSEVTTT